MTQERQEIDRTDPKYDRFRDVFFSRIYDKDGNDVTEERMRPPRPEPQPKDKEE